MFSVYKYDVSDAVLLPAGVWNTKDGIRLVADVVVIKRNTANTFLPEKVDYTALALALGRSPPFREFVARLLDNTNGLSLSDNQRLCDLYPVHQLLKKV